MGQYVTDEIRALIGLESESTTSAESVEAGAVRRFTQAVMDNDPVYWDPAAAEATPYREVVAPPLYPVHAFRRAAGTPDPLDQAADNPHFDGTGGSVSLYWGLQPVPVPLPRLLNGGNEIEFFQCAKVGKNLTVRAKYLDIYEQTSKSGTVMVFIVVQSRFFTSEGELLLINRQTLIRR